MVKAITGDYKVRFHPDGPGTERELLIDFTPPFRKVPMLKGLEEKLGVEMPKDLYTPEANEFFSKLALQHNVLCPAPRTTARLIDKVH